jgi:hypothetical protein
VLAHLVSLAISWALLTRIGSIEGFRGISKGKHNTAHLERELELEVARLRGKPLPEPPRRGENFANGTPTSSSASATHSDDSTAKPPTQCVKIRGQSLRLLESNERLTQLDIKN